MANAITYIKNVGKSIGYASVDVLKEKNPVFADFAETNGELASDMYKTIRDLKKKIRRLPGRLRESEYTEVGQTYLDNLMSDLKSGKLYNKERKDKYEEEAAGVMLGGDIDMSVFDDFGEGGEESNSDGLDDEISANDMMDMVGEKSATAVSTAVARSAEYIVQSNNQSNKTMYTKMNVMYGGIHTGMSTINQNISKLLEFSNENANTHFENSKTFYVEVTRMDIERNNYLKEISESLKEMNNTSKSSNAPSGKKSYADLVTGEGILDLSAYKDYLKKSIKDNSGGVFDLFEMATPAMLKTFAASPLEGLTTMMISSIIPKALDKSMETLNKSLSGMAGNALMALKNKAKDGEIWGLINDIFGINTELQTTVDTKNYEKGKVPFDGITRKAIIEVIPTYLSKILSTLNGQQRDTFDYESGKFVTVKSLEGRINELTKSNANMAASELDSRLREKAKSLSFRNKDQEYQFWKDWEKVKQQMYEKQMSFNTRDKNINAGTFGLEGGLASDVNIELLKKLLDGEAVNLNYANRMYRQISEQNRQVADLESSGQLSAAFNESESTKSSDSIVPGGISSLLGKANTAIVDKLNDIHKELSYIRIHGTGGSSSGVQRYKYKPDFKDFNIPTTKSVSTKVSKTTSVSKEENDDWKYVDDSMAEATAILAGTYKTEEVKPITDKEVIKEEKDKEKKKKKTLSERMAELKKTALGVVQGPLNLASSVIDKVDSRLYDIVFGPEGGRPEKDEDDDRSLKEVLFDNLQNHFDKFADWMQERVFDPLTTKSLKENAHDAAKKFLGIFGIDLDKTVEGIKDFLFGVDENGNPTKGGFLGKFVNDFKDSFKSFGNWIKDGFKDVDDSLGIRTKKSEKGKSTEKTIGVLEKQLLRRHIGKKYKDSDGEIKTYTEEDANAGKTVNFIQTYATGARRINDTGVAILSEGELVIPPDMNPFNIAKRKREENKVKNSLGIDNIYQYNEGTTNALSTSHNKSLDPKNVKEKILSYKDEKSSLEYLSKLREQFNNDDSFAEFLRKVKNVKLDAEYDQKSLLSNSFSELLSSIEYAKNTIVDNLAVSTDDTEKFKENASNFIDGIKEHGGTLAAGATIGAGVSLITGLVGGPLVGAAVGAGTALIAKSKTVQNMLFGNEEEGKQGLLPKDFTNALKKYVPDMGKGAAIGGLTAMLPFIPGGPIAGIIAGSAIGFAKNNQSIQDVIFGDDGFIEDKDAFKDKVKKALPKMGAGALVGLVAGPFGLATNMLLGSAIGLATSSDTFKDMMFGEVIDGKRSGGIIGSITQTTGEYLKNSLGELKTYVKEDILAPVKNAMAPIAEDFKLITKKIGDTISNFFKEKIGQPIERFIKNSIVNPIGKFIKNTLGLVIKPLKSIIAAPFKLIGSYGDARRKSHIRSGNARYMGAEQRNAFRKSKGLVGMGGHDDYEAFDQALEKVTNDDLETMTSAFAAVRDARTTHAQTSEDAFKRVKKEIYSDKNSVKTHIAKAALDMVKKGQYAEAIKFIEESDVDSEAKIRIKTKLAQESARIKIAKEMRDKTGTGASRIATLAKGLGFEIDEERLKNDSKYADTILKNLEGEQKYREKYQKSPIQELNDDQKDRHDQIVNIITDIRDALVRDKNIDAEDFSRKTKFEKFNNQFESLNDGETTVEEINAENNEKINKRNLRASYSRARMKAAAKSKELKKSISEIKSETFNYLGNVRKDIIERDGYKKYFGDKNKNYYGDPEKVKELPLNEKLGLQLRKSYRDAKKLGFTEIDDSIPEDGKMSKAEIQALKEKIALRSGGKIISNLAAKGDEKSAEAADHMAKIVATMAAKEGIDLKRINYEKDLGSEITRITSKYKNNKVTQFFDGHSVVFRKDKNGELIPDPSSAENKEYFKYREEEKETQKGILGRLSSLPTSLGNLFSNLFGNKDEDKKSIFQKILDFFTGNGTITLATVFSAVLKSAIPAALLALGITGKLDNIANKITGGSFGAKNSNSTMVTRDSNGNNVEIMLDENGDPVTDADGNYIGKNGQPLSSDSYLRTTKAQATMTLSDRLKYNLVRGTVTGKGSIVGTAIKSNKLVKGAVGVSKNISKKSGLSTFIKAATNQGAMDDVINGLMNATDTFIKALKKVPFLKKYVNDDMIINLSTGIGNLIEKYLPKAGASLSKIGKSLSKIALPLAIALAVSDFSTGWQDASTILKIKAENVTTPQKIVCGLIRTFKNLIPVVGTFIPDQVITDLFINHVAKWFGIDVSEITKQRDEAEAELAEYNAENGTNYSWAEYNKKILGNYTWTEKIGNSVSSYITNVKEKGLIKGTVSGIKDSIQNSKLVKAGKDAGAKIKEKVSSAISTVNEKLQPAKDVGSYAINVVKDTIKEIFTGKEIQSDNLKIDENDPYGSIKKSIYNIIKILTFIPSSLTKMGRFLWEKIKSVGEGIVTIGKGLSTSVKNQFINAWKGDIKAAFTDTSGVESDNALINGISNVVNFIPKITLAVPTLLTAGLGATVRGIKTAINGLKTIGGSVAQSVKNQFTNAWNGDVKAAFTDTSANLQTGNKFLDTTSAVVNFIPKIVLGVPTLITAGIGSAVNGLKKFVGAVAEAGTLSAEDQSILDKSNNGEISVFSGEYWKVNTQLSGPAAAFNTFISLMKKVFNIPSALIAQVSHSNLLENITNKVASWLKIDDSETGSRSYSTTGRGSGVSDEFISQVDPRYRNKQFNISGDSQVQTLGDTGCAPAAAAMAVNSTYGTQKATMESAAKLALKYKVKDDGVNASYFNDEFARHGISANYITASDANARSKEISRQLMSNNKVVLMGQDPSNTSKAVSPFGPNPHYVVANGLSADGKFIYINDPESGAPNIKYSADRILKSSKLGISANVAMGSRTISNAFKKYTARGTYGKDTVQYKVWNALRTHGYSEIATAAAMGNIQHESGFNVSAIEKGSGAGFGLIQWTGDRRIAIENYAKKKGVSASSLELQLEYLLMELEANSGVWTNASSKYKLGSLSRNTWVNSSNIEQATKAFMCCFERPAYSSSVNHIDRRIAAAKEFYQAFTGTAIDTNLNYNTTATSDTTTSSSSSSSSPITTLLGAISTFGTKLAQAYGIISKDTTEESTSTDTPSTDDTTVVSGNTVSNTEKSSLQKALVEKMYSIQGKLKYAQNNAKYPGSRNPEDGSGDCSSTIQWAYQKVLGVDPGSWTGAQRTNPNTYTVATSTSDESRLQLGDLLLKDGHVEMYAGNNTMIGHGGGKNGKLLGPTVKALDKSGKYDLVRRWVGFKGSGSGLFGRGSDIHPAVPVYDNALRHINSAELTSMLPFGITEDKHSQNQVSVMQYNNNKLSEINIKDARKSSKYNGRSAKADTTNSTMVELVKAILKLLTQVVTNTDQLNNISKLLGEYLTATEIASTDNTQKSKDTAILARNNLITAMQNSTSSNEPNAQLMRLIQATEKIARE